WAKFRMLAEQKESRIEEGHLLPDHVDMMIAIPPKYAVSQVVGFIKGKSAIHLAQVDGEQTRNFVGSTFGQEDSYVSSVGRAEAGIGAVAPHCAVPPHSRISPDRRIAPHGGVPPHRRGVINKTDGL